MSGRPGDFGLNAKRIEALLRWVRTTKPSPARNIAATYNSLLTNDLQPIRESAEKAGEAAGRDTFNPSQQAERAAWEAADSWYMVGPEREQVVQAVRDAALAVQVWDLVPDLADRLYEPIGRFLNERDLSKE